MTIDETIDETIDLLTIAAAFDRRTVGEADVTAWHAAVGDLPFADARQSVIDHYRDSRDWVMPADVRRRVKAMRRERLERTIVAAPSPELADNAKNYRAALQNGIRQIADGRTRWLEIAAPVREDRPPEEFTEARAALGPALPAGRYQGRSLQEIALQQAAESRAARARQDAEPGECEPEAS